MENTKTIQGKCKVCGVIYETHKSGNKSVCGWKCQKVVVYENTQKEYFNTRRTNKVYYCNCIVCGKLIASNKKDRKYCGVDCRKFAYSKLPKAPPKVYTHTCEECNTIFTSNRPKQRFCNKECCEHWGHKIIDKKCGRCENIFTGTRSSKYCDNCRRQKQQTGKRENREQLITVIPEIKIKTAAHYKENINMWNVPGFNETLRQQVLSRDGWRCYICDKETNLHIHHIVPRREGGKHEAENLVTLCGSCHRSIESGNMETAIEKCIGRAMREVDRIVG